MPCLSSFISKLPEYRGKIGNVAYGTLNWVGVSGVLPAILSCCCQSWKHKTLAGFLSGQRELTVNQPRELRGFESLSRHRFSEARIKREVTLSQRICKANFPRDKVFLVAPIAQSAEHLHGKEKVKGSIPFRGSGRGVNRALCGGVAQLVRAHDS